VAQLVLYPLSDSSWQEMNQKFSAKMAGKMISLSPQMPSRGLFRHASERGSHPLRPRKMVALAPGEL